MSSTAYKDEDWVEMLDGKTIAMSPRPTVNHNIITVNITRIFGNFLSGKSCTVFGDGVDVHLTKKDIVIPDVIIVCNKDIIKYDGIYGTPDLIVEVLSPSTAKRDKGYKKNLYEKCGVKEYWIVNTESRSVEVYLLKENKLEYEEIYTVYPDYLIKKLSDEEKKEMVYEFTTSLFPDMIISLEKIFEGMFPNLI